MHLFGRRTVKLTAQGIVPYPLVTFPVFTNGAGEAGNLPRSARCFRVNPTADSTCYAQSLSIQLRPVDPPGHTRSIGSTIRPRKEY